MTTELNDCCGKHSSLEELFSCKSCELLFIEAEQFQEARLAAKDIESEQLEKDV